MEVGDWEEMRWRRGEELRGAVPQADGIINMEERMGVREEEEGGKA